MATSGSGRGGAARRGGGLRPAATPPPAPAPPAPASHPAPLAIVVVLSVAVALLVVACVSPQSGLTPGRRESSVFPGVTPLPPYSRLEPVRWRPAPKQFLRDGAGWRWARLDRSWRQTLARHVLPLSREVSLVPMDLAGDGGLFATIFSPEFTGIVKVAPGGADFTPVHAFGDPENDQAVGSFDGRWLVWYEYHSFDDFSEFEVFSWDSIGGEVRQIGAAVPAPDGGFWVSSWRKPDVRDGLATWTQGVGPDELREVHVVDLAAGRDRVIYRGRAGESFLAGDGIVVWSEVARTGAPLRFRAATAATGVALPTPPSLRAARGASGLVTDGAAIAFPDREWQALWWSPALDVRPRLVASSPPGRFVNNSLQVSGRYLAFTVAPYTYLADTETRRYFQIGPGGWVLLDDDHLAMRMPSRQKATHGITDVVLVPLSELTP